MDKIWYRNPSNSEVIGCCGGDEKNEWSRRTDKKSNAKKTINKKNNDITSIHLYLLKQQQYKNVSAVGTVI